MYHSQPNIQDEVEMEKVLQALPSHRCVKLLTEIEEFGGRGCPTLHGYIR